MSANRFQSYTQNKNFDSFRGSVSDKSQNNSPNKKRQVANRGPKIDDNRFHSARDTQTPITSKLQDSLSLLELDDSQFKSRQSKQMVNANSYSIKSQKDVKINRIPVRDLQFRYVNGVTSYMPMAQKKRMQKSLVHYQGFSFRNNHGLS